MRKQKGFTLIELLLSSMVGLLIAASAYAVYKSAKADTEVKKTYDLVDVLFRDAQLITVNKTVFTVDNVGGGEHDLTIADLLNAKGGIDELPNGTFLVNGTTISHPMGGDLTVSSQSSTGVGAKDLVEITLTQVPRRQCTHFLSRVVNANVYDMYVNNQLVGLFPAADANSIGRSEVRPEHASGLCAANQYSTIRVRQLKEIHYSKMRASPYGPFMSTQESANITPLYNRNEAALTAREAAQVAIP